MTRAGASELRAGLPRHLPRGVRPALDELLGLRRFGAAMRSVLALEDQRRAGPRPPSARTHGMDYAESRPYSAGDDARRIDWRVTARSGRVHTKVFRLERGDDLYCLVDQRAPMRFGTRAALKSVVAAHLAALAGWAAAEGGNRFGALIADARDACIGVGAAEGAAAALCRALALPPHADDASISATACDDAALDRRAIRAAAEAAAGTRFIVVSDFADSEPVLERAVKTLRSRGDVVLVWVLDEVEVRVPPPARYPLTDGREHLVLDTARAGVRAAHAREYRARAERLARRAAQPGTRCIVVRTGEELFGALARPFAPP